MQTNRRDFVMTMGVLLGTSALMPTNKTFANMPEPQEPYQNDDFWAWIRQSYTTNPNIINLNNGGVCPQPKVVQDAFIRYNQLCNEGPAYYMWQILDRGREPLRQKLASISGCSSDEIAINRNTTEGIDTVIYGLKLRKGDEVVLCKYDYPNVINAWKQREMRDGIVIKWVDIPTPAENDSEIVDAFKSAFTSRTRIVNITHMINWNGQLLPAKKIADAAHKTGAEVIVDGAHTFNQINFRIDELDCDYFATSLHKWLCAPFGTGMLYVKKEKITDLYPLFPNDNPQSDDIRKFEALGTRSFPAEQAIGEAINFFRNIGIERKEKRLRFLKDYWAKEVAKFDRIKFYTSFDPAYSCCLFNFGIDGMDASDISSFLFDKYKLYTVAIKWEKINGVRVTPNVYTSLQDLDKLIEGIYNLTKK